MQGANTCVLDLESLADSVAIRYNSRHAETRWDRVVVQTHLVVGDHHGTARDVNTHGELEGLKTVHLGNDVVVELATDVVVDCQRDWHLAVGGELAFVRRENERDSLVVRQEEGLLLLERLSLGEGVASNG